MAKKNNRSQEPVIFYIVPMRRLELPRASAHYTLNVACLPISPHGLWVEFLGFLECPGQESNLHDAIVTTPSK